MKIEMGESLFYSWLRHTRGNGYESHCQGSADGNVLIRFHGVKRRRNQFCEIRTQALYQCLRSYLERAMGIEPT